MLVRWSWPRFRFDQLMSLAWKVMLPLGLVNLVAVAMLVEYAASRSTAKLGVARHHRRACGASRWSAWIAAGIFAPLHSDNSARKDDFVLDAERPQSRHVSRRRRTHRTCTHETRRLPTSSGSKSRSSAWPARCTCRCSSQGLTTTTKHLVQPEGDGQLSRRAAGDRQPADLSRRASAEQRRARPREVRRLLPLRHGLPGALHRHHRRAEPLARSREVSARASRSTSCAASSAACAKRPARSTRSS